jgi:lysophospholipase L1-like esterase
MRLLVRNMDRVGKAAAARKLAAAAAYGGGGLTALGGGLYGVLRLEAELAKRTIGERLDEDPPDATGWYGRGRPGPAVKIALLGDSSAAGYGCERVEQTPGALLASGVAEQADRRVYLREFAVVGAESQDLAAQVDRTLPIEPDVAVVLIGANDVTHRVRPATSVRHLAESVQRLREAGVAVLVGTCPDLGTLKPIVPPLKQVARTWSRRLAAAQTIAVLENGGRTVSLGSILGPEFAAAPAILFGPDQFHPSVTGYRSLVGVLLPSTLAALGLVEEEPAGPARGEGVLPIADAAIQAVKTPGTELDGTEVSGRRLGVRGLWVELRHRRRQQTEDAQAPDDVEESEDASSGTEES